MNTELKHILEEIRQYSENGNRRALSSALRKIIADRKRYYHESLTTQLLDEYTNALYKILLLELDNEEEESIEIAELAYLSICTLLKETPDSPEHYKRRMLLLHYFCDYFTDAIIEIFFEQHKKSNLLQARNLAIECLEKMQLSDIFYLEDHEADFLDKDEQLTDACNNIATTPDLSDEEKKDAELLHKVMHAYLMAKYKN